MKWSSLWTKRTRRNCNGLKGREDGGPVKSGSHMSGSPFSRNSREIFHKSPAPSYQLQYELRFSSICISRSTIKLFFSPKLCCLMHWNMCVPAKHLSPEHICSAICRVCLFKVMPSEYLICIPCGRSSIIWKVHRQLGCPGTVPVGKGNRVILHLIFMFIGSDGTLQWLTWSCRAFVGC